MCVLQLHCDAVQLSAAYNQITDMTLVTQLCSLTVLNLSNNNITSIKCMYHARALVCRFFVVDGHD